jgi:hypothetical protein
MHYVVNTFAVIGVLAVLVIGWAIWDDYQLTTSVVRDSQRRRKMLQNAQNYPGSRPVISYVPSDPFGPYDEEYEPVDHFGDGAYGPGCDLNVVDSNRRVCMTNWNDRVTPEETREPYYRN